MNKIEFAQGMKLLTSCYRNMNFDQTTMNVWYCFFENYEVEAFHRAIENYVISNKFEPTVKDLLDYLDAVIFNVSPTNLDDVWNTVRKYVQRYGCFYEPEVFLEKLAEEDPIASKVSEKYIDEFAMMVSHDLADIRRRFQNSYLEEEKQQQLRRRKSIANGGVNVIEDSGTNKIN